MKAILIIIVILVIIVGATTTPADPVTETKPAETIAHVEKTPPWLGEVREILAKHDDTLAALEQEFNQATNENQAMAIQRRIQKLEETTELQIMNTQLDHLKQHGRTEEAESLAILIKEMTEPRPARDPEPREEPERR